MFDLFKKYGLVAALWIGASSNAEEITLGLIGGNIDSAPYAATISTSSTIPRTIPLSLTSGTISAVALNAYGYGLIGGTGLGAAYAAKIDPSSNLTQILGLPSPGNLFGVAINDSGIGLVGGNSLGGGYVALISPSSNLPAQINVGLNTLGDSVFDVDINNSNQGIIGGRTSGSSPYAALIVSNVATPVFNLAAAGSIDVVAINESGAALLGGQSTTFAYAAYIAPSSNVATQVFLSTSNGTAIHAVAINDAGLGLIGGSGGTIGGFASLVSANSSTPILDLPTPSSINSVALNNTGQGLLGGSNGSGAYLASLSPTSNLVSEIPLGIASGFINAVAINEFGQGIAGGSADGMPYAAVVYSNTAIPLFLNISESGLVDDVAINSILPFFSFIPTTNLKGNNLKFAEYINQYAPQDAFYFVPALFDGTLSQALQSAAPTRNAISFNTVMQNSFYFTTTLSTHLRDQQFMRGRGKGTRKTAVAALGQENGEDQFMTASLSTPEQKSCTQTCVKPRTCACTDPYVVWVEAIGAFASQDKQHQTPEFSPSSGGAILAFDGRVSDNTRVGAGASYLYTHVDEKTNAGHSNINQESLFVYASWDNSEFYLDGALWGGLFQTSQTRNIELTGLSFTSTSKPDGGQLTPHLELGYNGTVNYTQNFQFVVNPLVMLDWANAWQGSYHEKGTGPFNAGQKSKYASLLRTELSLRFSEILFFPSWNFILQEKGGYVNTQSFGAGKVKAFLVGSPGTFTVETLTDAQNLGVVQLLMTFAPHATALPMGTLFYQGEFGSGYRSHQVNFELTWNF